MEEKDEEADRENEPGNELLRQQSDCVKGGQGEKPR